VTDLAPGDHIVTTFIPVCGKCRSCRQGRENLCENGTLRGVGTALDGTFRKHFDGLDVAEAGFVSTFSEFSVMPVPCCVKVPEHIKLESAALIGCGVPTGWGSAVNAAAVRPGDYVVILGAGGIGSNAVQGARFAGAEVILVVDPMLHKRTLALDLGATHTAADLPEARQLLASLTVGHGADAVIVTITSIGPSDTASAFELLGPGGSLVLVSAPEPGAVGIPVDLLDLMNHEKRIVGVFYGMRSPHNDVRELLRLYEAGHLKLDQLVTRTYSLDDINVGFEDLRSGTNLRGVIVF
jgi:S-(hydroxymethyl)glutathione dehydrogenase/alcohol dehydrogenase